ncbi:unnamed protein product [Dovyalis caffra]|uniref:Uncharacterized protein n=1 Tax=Dovyalis caffra TaxID=77055 RepID=A0AAV1RKC1_9ROSI|nr:unnamed protein product [Dovyalis caffra]
MTQRALTQIYPPAVRIIDLTGFSLTRLPNSRSNPKTLFVASRVLKIEQEEKMGFIMEFAENLVLRLMEDPKERDRKFREHVYAVKDRCQKTKEMWSYPLRPYGFWTFERHNAQLAWDAKISQVPGRRDPYDDLLQDSYGFSK